MGPHAKPPDGGLTGGRPFVAVSRFVVKNDMGDAVDEAFRARPHLVDDAPGFLRMEVMRSVDDPREFWLLTWWTGPECFESWHRGHTYREAHAGIPKGLKLVTGSARLDRLRQIVE